MHSQTDDSKTYPFCLTGGATAVFYLCAGLPQVNMHEVELCVAMVRYMLQQGYQPGGCQDLTMPALHGFPWSMPACLHATKLLWLAAMILAHVALAVPAISNLLSGSTCPAPPLCVSHSARASGD